MKCIALLVVLQLLVICCYAEVAEVLETASLDELKKFPIAKLRKILMERGLECKGCAEKEDYVTMAFEKQNLPILPPKVVEAAPEADEASKKIEHDKIMESLRNSGFGGAKMYTAEELKNLSPDDMAKKFESGGAGLDGKKKRNSMKNGAKESQKKEKAEKKKSKLSSTVRNTNKSNKDKPDEDHIEL